jgi:hypothetical protein
MLSGEATNTNFIVWFDPTAGLNPRSTVKQSDTNLRGETFIPVYQFFFIYNLEYDLIVCPLTNWFLIITLVSSNFSCIGLNIYVIRFIVLGFWRLIPLSTIF